MNVPNCIRYDVSLAIHPEPMHPAHKLYGGAIDVDCLVTIENHTLQPVDVVPFLLYRLLHVAHAGDGAGQSLPFAQDVVALEKLPRKQVNAVIVTLPTPLPVGASAQVRLQYGGPVCGYPEVFPYVHDHVSESYTLLRWDVLWFPLVGEPVDAHPGGAFDFDLSVTVPDDDLVVVGNGQLCGKSVMESGVCHRWRSVQPVIWGRMTVACAPFERTIIATNVSLYYLAEDAVGAQVVAKAMNRARELCSTWFGPLPPHPLNIVEIPAGYGSEASANLILQTAGAFKAKRPDDRQAYRHALSGAGHEMIHLWNAPSREKHVTRFLDEGITQYIEALLLREEFGEDAYWQRMDDYRSFFLSGGGSVLSVPLAEAGRHDKAREYISRGKGPWVLCVLNRLIGDRLLAALCTFFDRYRTQGATLQDFQATVRDRGRGTVPLFSRVVFGCRVLQASGARSRGTRIGRRARPKVRVRYYDAYQSIQPTAHMDICEIKKSYGDKTNPKEKV